jgi:hypothetical protein
MWKHVYPTNKFGHHNNVQYYFYNRYVTQGNNWANYGLHLVEVRNESDQNVEVVGWKMKDGRVEEDFKTNVVRPGLFYSARTVPMSWGTHRAIVGAVVFRIQGTNQYFTLSFEDPFHNIIGGGYKGHIEEGDDVDGAIFRLQDSQTKEYDWGSYHFQPNEGRGKSVIVFKGRK